MYVRHLGLRDFRSWPHADIDLEPGRTVFVGPNGYGKTKLHNGLFEQKLGSTATTRNWSTVTKLADMARG